MFLIFKFAFQLWHTMDVDDEKRMVVKGALTAEQFKEITGEDYVEGAA